MWFFGCDKVGKAVGQAEIQVQKLRYFIYKRCFGNEVSKSFCLV